MTNEEYKQRRELQSEGWNAEKNRRYNTGIETIQHSAYKNAVGHYLYHEREMSVDFEVAHDSGIEIDVVGWGSDEWISPIAVEIERNPEQETIETKREQYTSNTAIQELYVIKPYCTEINKIYDQVKDDL